MTRKIQLITITLLSLTLLSACENAKEELGLTRSSPDEFAVVKRAPLEMPPEFGLRPPQPGAPRPQEQATSDQAREALMGPDAAPLQTSTANNLTTGEAALLTSANATSSPNIRNIVDYEAANTQRKDEPVVKKLLNIGGDQLPPATLVDPKAETERLKNNAATGQPVTAGKTPIIED